MQENFLILKSVLKRQDVGQERRREVGVSKYTARVLSPDPGDTVFPPH